MRLTLRTLLAFLDNTLEPADAELLRQKLAGSGFATQLVQRIRANLVDASLPAPPPEAVGPIRDANVIGEFLDSTLPAAQVSEIERACLESDPSLAETAACHQILTMVLGQPAEVPAALRQRIYELPDREVERIAASSQRFSSLQIEKEDPPSLTAELPTTDSPSPDSAPVDSLPGNATSPSGLANAPSTLQPGRQVHPVGPNDSGVSDAPTRLRESGVLDRNQFGLEPGEPAIAGDRTRGRDDGLYERSIRPSRITPWLVSLAIAGVLLFVVAQIFRPLLDGRTAGVDDDPNKLGQNEIGVGEVEVPPSQSPPLVPIDPEMEKLPPPGGEDQADDVQSLGDLKLPPGEMESDQPAVTDLGDEAAAMPAMPAPDASIDAASIEGEPSVAPELAEPSGMPAAIPATAEAVPANPELAESDSTAPQPMEPESTQPSGEPGDRLPGPDALAMSSADPDEAAPKPSESMKPSDAPEEPAEMDTALEAESPPIPVDGDVVAMLDAENALVVALQANGEYARLDKNAEIRLETPLVCAPKFRTLMQPVSIKNDQAEPTGVEITLVGPTGVRWQEAGGDEVGLDVAFGRLLITSKKPDVSLALKLGEQTMMLTFKDQETVAAAIIRHTRMPGADPLDPASEVELAAVMSVQGDVEVLADGTSQPISTGQRWAKIESDKAEIVDSEAPSWVDPQPSGATTLDDYAREGLLELVAGDDPVELALREATHFRKAEVAALAAQSLLFLGQGDVFFGGDGILNDPKQRAYWSDHFQALETTIDQGPESAQLLRRSIIKMDSANAASLFRLLVGYSQKQLVEGGDEELVKSLDSDSMAVRVLAIENLQEITGTTLSYKPDQEIAVRRAPAMKKWVSRQQKGDIRRRD